MTFGTLIPLVFLIGVPIIIIMYLMKPKGTRKVIPSLLLWRDAEKNEKSVKFSKRLIKNILMFLEIGALLFLMFAAMSPVIKKNADYKVQKSLIIIDSTGSMQFRTEDGLTRFQKAVNDAKDYVEMSSGEISIISAGAGMDLMANSVHDRSRLKKILNSMQCSDAAGDLSKAEGIIESLGVEKIFVFTDGNGADALERLADRYPMDIYVYGESSDNVALTQMSVKRNEKGLCDVAFAYEITGNASASFDISLYDERDNLIEVRTVDNADTKSGSVLMLDKEITGEYVRGEISSVKFQGKDYESDIDGLDRDNEAFAITEASNDYDAYLFGVGNIYVEKAYTAATGNVMIKSASDDDAMLSDRKTVGIYDNAALVAHDMPRMILGFSGEGSTEIQGSVITVRTEELMSDMTDFNFGASRLHVLEVPSWGKKLMTVILEDGSEGTVAYYGEHDGIREIVLGFDVRDSEFPLMAEFPIFIADSMSYLTDERSVQETYIQAGGMITLNPSIDSNTKPEGVRPHISPVRNYDLAGLYKVGDTFFVVRFPVMESDGSVSSESLTNVVSDGYGIRYSSLRKVCLVIALVLLIINTVIYCMRNRRPGKLPVAARICLITLIVLSIIGISLPGKRRGNATIFLVDMSDSSIISQASKEDYLRSVISTMPSGDSFAIVTFGGDAITDQFLSTEPEYLQIASVPKNNSTNIEGAVEYASAMLPDDKYGRIVLLTDGKETIGDVSNVLGLLRDNETELCLKLYENEEVNDVYLESADMPEKLATGDKYNLKVTVYSTYETNAVLKVWKGSEIESQSEVRLVPGENTFVLQNTAGDNSIEEKNISIEAEGDIIDQNNHMVAAAMVDAPRKTLLISGMSEDSTGFESLLKGLNTDLTEVSAINAPETIAEMMQYKTIIIDNCYYTDLPEGFTQNIESYVKDYGGGLISTGGTESYAPGGYTDTPLEKALPVNMLPKGVDESPSLAMVMVIDCSGSMDSTVSYDQYGGADGRKKIDVAVDAAQEAVNNMRRNDMVGVLTFSDTYKWRQPLVHVEDKDAINSEINKIGIDGGTVIKPALLEAANNLKDLDVGVKHILLLTDGEGETTDFSDAVNLINDNGITLSTIAVGEDSDTKLLESLAEQCGGRYYYSDSSSEVPKIFTEEVYLSGDTYYKNGDYSLSISSGNKLVDGLYADGLPNISGYIATTAKNGSREVISTSEEDPLLVSWQYGLGTSVSWMSTASGTWNESLAGMEDYASMWKRILDMTVMDETPGEDKLIVNKRRGVAEVSFQTDDYSEDTSVTGVYTSPSGETGELTLTSERPGEYTGSFVSDEPGVYSISVRRNEKNEAVSVCTAIQTVQFSDEYRRDISNQNLVSFVEKNGRILKEGENVFTRLKGRKNNKKSITLILIVLSIIMLILDIIVRRFDIGHLLDNRFAVYRQRRAVAGTAGRTANVGTAGRQTNVGASGSQAYVGTSGMPVDAGAQGSPEMSGSAESVYRNQSSDNKIENKKRDKKKDNKKRRKEEAFENQLDTAALLKKKNDRNL